MLKSLTDQKVIDCLNSGGVVVARTDTLYGVLARADDSRAVDRVYRLKERSEHKSPIVLIAEKSQLYDEPSDAVSRLMDANWPGAVSIIVESEQAPNWIRRANNSVAYRMPDISEFRAVLQQTGPLIAPSANLEAHEPALGIEEAYDYFGDQVDIYVNGGRVYDDTPSKLLRIDAQGNVERLR